MVDTESDNLSQILKHAREIEKAELLKLLKEQPDIVDTKEKEEILKEIEHGAKIRNRYELISAKLIRKLNKESSIKYLDYSYNSNSIKEFNYSHCLEKYKGCKKGEENVETRFLVTVDFSDDKYEVYFDLVDQNYKIDLPELDTDRKYAYMKALYYQMLCHMSEFYRETYAEEMEVIIMKDDKRVTPHCIIKRITTDTSKKCIGVVVKKVDMK